MMLITLRAEVDPILKGKKLETAAFALSSLYLCCELSKLRFDWNRTGNPLALHPQMFYIHTQ